MPPPKRIAPGNRLIASLPSQDWRRLLAGSEMIELELGEVLYDPTEPLRYVYFPIHCFVSLIMPIDPLAELEVGLVGSEGMVGLPVALGVDISPVRAVVQGKGSALRTDAVIFRRELERSTALRREVDRYVFVQMSQLAQTAACTRFHVVEARLARWLLMTQDRARNPRFEITQHFMAMMLGVRRVGVTKAAGALQDRGLIHYRRGNMSIIDRRGLKAASCGCYKADRDAYDRIFAGGSV